jgi:hypothetical protein
MDADIWAKSKRGFPFNISLEAIVAFALGAPLIASFIVFDYSNLYLWKVYLFTLAISLLAYFVTDKAVE